LSLSALYQLNIEMNRLSLNRAAVELPFEEFAHLCELLESSFPQHSINKLSQNNRLKRLWFAENWLSTIELLTLANSVRVMSEVDRKWTENHTKKILGKSTNEQIGSVFELNCATMLSEANLKVKPGRNNSPGYDLEVVYDDEHRLFLSLKNHDISSFENGFKMTSESLFSTINQIFSPTGVPTFVMIDFSQYPEPGVIMRDQGRTLGLTTAATLWTTASLGLATAYGMYVLSILGAIITFGLLAIHHMPGWNRISKTENGLEKEKHDH
jgi:hypothetical protein